MGISGIIGHLNEFQQRHPVVGFPYAVIKKFGDDSGGYQAALITYYGFLSLFPLLLMLVTVLHIWFANNPTLQDEVSQSINSYFPLLGEQLESSIGNVQGTGIGLSIGFVLTIYGARGVADALRFALDNMWEVPKKERSGFPKNIVQSLGIIGVGCLGFITTVGISIVSSSLGRAGWVKILLNIIGFVMVSAALTCIFRIATSRRIAYKKLVVGASIAGALIQLLLTFGSILVSNQLHNLDSLYGTFAIVLGLLFWIYLLAQVVVYAAEIDTVRAYKLWPRSLDANQPTEGDKAAYRLQAKTERYIPPQQVKVKYTKETKNPKNS